MRKLLIVNMGGHGHVNPTLGLTEALVARGHAVTYAVTEPFAEAIRATGATCKAYDSLWGKLPAPTAEMMQELIPRMPLRLMAECRHVLPQLLDWAREERFEAVLYDSMSLAGRFLAEILGLPAVALFASYASNEHFNLRREFAVGPVPDEVRTEIAAERLALARDFGIQPPEIAGLLGHPEPLNLVFLPRAFQIAGETFDERYVFAGPSITPRPTAGRWAPAPGDRRPHLFISLGTVFSNWPEFFRTCYAAFGDTRWHVLMSTSTQVDAATLGEPPGNFTVAPHFPQLELLPHMQAFVTHSGMNSTMEALHFGVPMVSIPQMPEQSVTSRTHRRARSRRLAQPSDGDGAGAPRCR